MEHFLRNLMFGPMVSISGHVKISTFLGVLLFEMYTGASMPYPTIESDDLLEALIDGVRPEISDDAPENM
jgi:hypothetical protein